MQNQKLIQHFFESFSGGNAEGMISCYGSDIHFKDPVFGELYSTEVASMWRMLLEKGGNSLVVRFHNLKSDQHSGSAEWIAEYTFRKTGRKVINKVKSTFEFQNGIIVRQTDQFSLWKWAHQALGWPGTLLGWTPFVKSSIRKMAKRELEKYIRSKS